MKSIKNLVFTGIALVITLCISTQITAMEVAKTVNPYLTAEQKSKLQFVLAATQQGLKLFTQGEESPEESARNKKMFNQKMGSEERRIERINEILYGNRAYTDQEMQNFIYPVSFTQSFKVITS